MSILSLSLSLFTYSSRGNNRYTIRGDGGARWVYRLTHSSRSSRVTRHRETVDIAFLSVPLSGPPETSADYLDRYVAQEGDTVKLLCPIVGNPKPIIEWYQVGHSSVSLITFSTVEAG